ncbi:MAG: [FeFe] hydrogenase H-cluster radical SAM maturase HydE, partial [Clostridium sp.]|nr:[FeFe] hydrogenase H-cluster radical SAM maturase HydE [Clostridium sp.]
MKDLIDKLYKENYLDEVELLDLLNNITEQDKEYLRSKAHDIRMRIYGNRVFMRGLIEFTNYCKNNCVYCGIRALNKNADRYRLDLDEILECCREGYRLGYRTFVL